MNSKWIDDAFKSARLHNGEEIDTFFNELPTLLAAYEKAISAKAAKHVAMLMVSDKDMARFVGLCFGAGMVCGRRDVLQNSPD